MQTGEIINRWIFLNLLEKLGGSKTIKSCSQESAAVYFNMFLPYSQQECCGCSGASRDLLSPLFLLWLRSSSQFPRLCCTAPLPPAADLLGQRSKSSPQSAGSSATQERCAADRTSTFRFKKPFFLFIQLIFLASNIQYTFKLHLNVLQFA